VDRGGYVNAFGKTDVKGRFNFDILGEYEYSLSTRSGKTINQEVDIHPSDNRTETNLPHFLCNKTVSGINSEGGEPREIFRMQLPDQTFRKIRFR
jgi:hypothetical protein